MAIHRENAHEMFGYDFMVDTDFNVWLIEVNSSPCMDYSTKVTETLVKEVIKDLTSLIFDYNNGSGETFDNPDTKSVGKL